MRIALEEILSKKLPSISCAASKIYPFYCQKEQPEQVKCDETKSDYINVPLDVIIACENHVIALESVTNDDLFETLDFSLRPMVDKEIEHEEDFRMSFICFTKYVSNSVLKENVRCKDHGLLSRDKNEVILVHIFENEADYAGNLIISRLTNTVSTSDVYPNNYKIGKTLQLECLQNLRLEGVRPIAVSAVCFSFDKDNSKDIRLKLVLVSCVSRNDTRVRCFVSVISFDDLDTNDGLCEVVANQISQNDFKIDGTSLMDELAKLSSPVLSINLCIDQSKPDYGYLSIGNQEGQVLSFHICVEYNTSESLVTLQVLHSSVVFMDGPSLSLSVLPYTIHQPQIKVVNLTVGNMFGYAAFLRHTKVNKSEPSLIMQSKDYTNASDGIFAVDQCLTSDGHFIAIGTYTGRVLMYSVKVFDKDGTSSFQFIELWSRMLLQPIHAVYISSSTQIVVLTRLSVHVFRNEVKRKAKKAKEAFMKLIST